MNEKLEFNSKKFDETSKSNKKIREDISIVITNFQKKINNLSNNSSDVFFSSIIDRNKLSSDFLNKLKKIKDLLYYIDVSAKNVKVIVEKYNSLNDDERSHYDISAILSQIRGVSFNDEKSFRERDNFETQRLIPYFLNCKDKGKDIDDFYDFLYSHNKSTDSQYYYNFDIVDMDEFVKLLGLAGGTVSEDGILSEMAEEEEADEEPINPNEEPGDEEGEEGTLPQRGNPNGDNGNNGGNNYNYDSGSNSSSSSSSSNSSSDSSSSSSSDTSKKAKEDTSAPTDNGKKQETHNETKQENHGNEVYVDPQPEPTNQEVSPTKFVPQNESSYHGGGGYSSEGYVSTTTSDSPVEEIIDDSTVSLEDVIKDNGIYPEIARKIPIENHGTAKTASGSNVIPIVAGLTSVGAAGLGSKAYLDHKRNNSDNDEYDEADEYDDYDETPEKVEEVDADVIINDNPDSDLNPLNNNESNDEVTFDDDDYS